MNFFGAAFIKALIFAVLLSSFLVDDGHGVTIVVRPSYRRIRIQGPSPTSSSSTSTTTTTAAATTTSEETTDETTTLASNEEQDDDDDVTSLPAEVPVEENSPLSVPESPEMMTSGEVEDEVPTEEDVDNSIRGGSDEQQQPSTAASVEEEAAVTTNVPISPTAESVVVDTDTSSASSVPERSSRLLAEEPTTTVSAEVETMPEEEEQTQETPAEAVSNNISQETAPESTTEKSDPLPPNTTEAISVEESVTDEPTTILPVPLVVEDFMNELVGPGREAKAIDDETVDTSSANNLTAELPIEEKEEGNSEDSKDVWGGMFGAADPFLSVMGGMLSTSTTPATDIATQATTIASSSIFKALFTESPVESSTENAQQQEIVLQVSEPTVEREASSELASEGQFEATSIESATTITSPEVPELPAILNRPGAFLSESTLKNLELLLEQDRKFKEEQEQALSFLKSIKTPLALDETVEVDKSGGFKSSSTAFPPIDTAPGAGGIVEEEEPPVSAEEEEEIGQRHQTGFFGGFRQLPPNLQTSGLSLPSQHQIGRPLFAARPFPGPLPPTLSGFPRATLLQPPNVPGGLSRRPSNDEEDEEPASRVVDPFLAASSPPLSVSRQRSAANKRSPPPPILVFDSPRSAPQPVSSPSVVTLLPSASRPAVQFMSRPVISRPAVTSAFRAAPVRRPSVPRSRLPTASASSAGLSDTILAASASGGNPFLVRLPSDRGRAGRQVVLQSHPDTEFVYTV